MNNDDKIFRHDETRDATRVRERDESNEWMFRKINNKIEENDQKIKKSDWKDEKHDWKKHLNKDNDQTVDDRDLNFFFARNQHLFETKIKQKDEINDIN